MPNEYAVNDIVILKSKELNLRQIDLINETGIQSSKMSKIFNKNLKPTIEDLEKLSIPLQMSKETLWVIAGYMLPPAQDSQVATELKNLGALLEAIHREEKAKEPFYERDTSLTAKEREFIEEYIEFVQYRKEKDR